jgi:perosamine synthetase
MRDSGIGVQVNYMPAHWHPVFKAYAESQNSFPVSIDFYRSEISLPMHVEVSEQDFENIIKSLRAATA